MKFSDFFGRKMEKPTIDWVTVPDLDWQLDSKDADSMVWCSPDGASILSVHFFDLAPDIAAPLTDVNGLRNRYRNLIAESNGGLVKLEVVRIKDIPAIEIILKKPMKRPEGVAQTGMSYLGSFTIPFRDCSYVVKVISEERGTTGMREAVVVLDEFLAKNIPRSPGGSFEGWFRDPYDETFSQGTPMNAAEAEEYDAKFLRHPLSIVRSKMKIIKKNMGSHKGIFDLTPF